MWFFSLPILAEATSCARRRWRRKEEEEEERRMRLCGVSKK
jgi:hypothetical protein